MTIRAGAVLQAYDVATKPIIRPNAAGKSRALYADTVPDLTVSGWSVDGRNCLYDAAKFRTTSGTYLFEDMEFVYANGVYAPAGSYGHGCLVSGVCTGIMTFRRCLFRYNNLSDATEHSHDLYFSLDDPSDLAIEVDDCDFYGMQISSGFGNAIQVRNGGDPVVYLHDSRVHGESKIKYGIVCERGANVAVEDMTIDACTVGILIRSDAVALTDHLGDDTNGFAVGNTITNCATAVKFGNLSGAGITVRYKASANTLTGNTSDLEVLDPSQVTLL